MPHPSLVRLCHAEKQHAKPLPPRHWADVTGLRLLALSPEVDLIAVANFSQYVDILRGMAMLAAISNRTLVWPGLPLRTPWVGRTRHRVSLVGPCGWVGRNRHR